MTDPTLDALVDALLPIVFGPPAADPYGGAAPDGCSHPEPETLPSQDPMKVSLPAAPNLIEGPVAYPPAELAESLDLLTTETLDTARGDLALLGMQPLPPAMRDLAEELHGALAHARHLAARLRDLTEAAR